MGARKYVGSEGQGAVYMTGQIKKEKNTTQNTLENQSVRRSSREIPEPFAWTSLVLKPGAELCFGLRSYRSAEVGDRPSGWKTEPHTVLAVSARPVGTGLERSIGDGGDGAACAAVEGVVGADLVVGSCGVESVRAALAWW